jgi:two-component system, LytTR family, response regulator
MRTIIIEDEALTAKNLSRLLKEIDPAIEIIATLDSIASSVAWLKENQQPDLIFMDIQLSDGVSFSIFEEVTVEAPVIFTTAYNDYAIRAFKVNSVDYLLKPIDKEYLEKALGKFRKYYAQGTNVMSEQIRSLISNIQKQDAPKYKERFLAHSKGGMLPVAENRVACFMKDNIIYLVTNECEKLVTDYHTIDEIEELVNPDKFFRANRQMIIAIDQVDTYKKHDTGKIEVHLKCDKNLRVDISREKANAFIDWLSK